MTRGELETLRSEIDSALADLRRKRARLGERPRDAFDLRRATDLDGAIRALEGDGLTHVDGLVHDLGWLAAKQNARAVEQGYGAAIAIPGLADIARRLAAMDAAERRERERVERWPASDTTHPYRYAGPRFKTTWDGDRYLEPGDVVELNEVQAAAFGDRFEAVS